MWHKNYATGLREGGGRRGEGVGEESRWAEVMKIPCQKRMSPTEKPEFRLELPNNLYH